jgi:ornithine cyclodeaminase/alanine dehydrogenase-like protein (mu-crystallin family)
MSDVQRILLLNRTQVRQAMKWPALLDACRAALINLASENALPSISAQLPVPGASLHLKAGALLSPPILSVKANLRPDAGSTSGAILAFDHGNQRLQAILASSDLTAMRTAAIAAVAATELVTKKNPRIALIGAGPVARYTDEALAFLQMSDEIRVWSRNIEHSRQLVASGSTAQKRIACSSVQEAVLGADLVITCTPSRTPLAQLEDLLEDVVVLAMGADSPGKRELGAGILERSSLYADVLEDALRVGELAHVSSHEADRARPIGLRLVKKESIQSSTGRTVFDSVGSSAVDAAVVAMTLEIAMKSGSGTWITLDD